MMKLSLRPLLPLLFLGLMNSCSTGDDHAIDTEKPIVDISYGQGFPKACERLERGKTYTFRAQLSDNDALASYSLDIHHNFDHHTHDDQGAQCELDAVKSAINPMILMENRPVEGGPRSFEIEISVAIPLDVDPGDYHCAFSVTDRNGWQGRTSVDIKIH